VQTAQALAIRAFRAQALKWILMMGRKMSLIGWLIMTELAKGYWCRTKEVVVYLIVSWHDAVVHELVVNDKDTHSALNSSYRHHCCVPLLEVDFI